MVLEMKIPSPGESITEVEISQWLVKDGDIVNKDQTIAEIDSDKATLDLPAEASGKITLKAEEGDSMSVGDVVCLIDTSQASNAIVSNSESNQQNIKEEKKIEANKIVDIGFKFSSCTNVKANKNSFHTAKPTTKAEVSKTGHERGIASLKNC